MVSAVPFLFSDGFEQGVLHVTVAEAAEQTGHDRALRNPLALTVGSETQGSHIKIERDKWRQSSSQPVYVSSMLEQQLKVNNY